MLRRTVCIPMLALALTGALVIAAPLAAASGNGSDLDRIAHSSQALVRAGSARFSGRVSITGSPTSDGTIELSGAFDFKHRSGQFNINAAALGAGSTSGRLTLRLVQNVAYLSVGSFRHLTRGSLPPELKDKAWIEIDPGKLGASAGGLEQANPASSLDFLNGTTNSVQNLGSQQVNGAPATHYRVQIDLTKALEKVPASERSQLQATIGTLGGAGIIPADVWLDTQGRPVKFELNVTVQQGATPVHLAETFQYSHFGTPVSTPVPPKAQVVDFTALLKALGASLGSVAGTTTTTAPAA
jgi:hypothetical protein